jgi:hypothetical protein
MIPPLGRYRARQGLNLQLPSFDRRVFRSNRMLTASENVSGRKSDKESTGACQRDSAEAPAPLEPFPSAVLLHPSARFRIPYCRRERGLMVAEVALSSLPRKMTPGEN